MEVGKLRRVYWGDEKPPLPEWGGRLPIAIVFPEEETLALSTLGWQVVYRLLSEKPDVFVAERFFGNGKHGEAVLSIDSGKPLSAFPLICFSLNFEGDYVNVLRLLKKSHLSLLAQKTKRLAPGYGWRANRFFKSFPYPAQSGFFLCWRSRTILCPSGS